MCGKGFCGSSATAGSRWSAPQATRRNSIRVADAHQPDVIIADIQMPPEHSDDGLRAALAIRAARPKTGMLVLSQFLEDAYAFSLVADGAQGVGYLLKEKVGDLRMFTDAVQRVAEVARCSIRTSSLGWWVENEGRARSTT